MEAEAVAGIGPREYRISQGHDSAPAGGGWRGGRRRRTGTLQPQETHGDFPIDAIQFCLREAGIALEDVDEIAHGFDYAPFARSTRLTQSRQDCTRRISERRACRAVAPVLSRFSRRENPAGQSSSRARRQRRLYFWMDECLTVVNRRHGRGPEPHRVSVSRRRF